MRFGHQSWPFSPDPYHQGEQERRAGTHQGTRGPTFTVHVPDRPEAVLWSAPHVDRNGLPECPETQAHIQARTWLAHHTNRRSAVFARIGSGSAPSKTSTEPAPLPCAGSLSCAYANPPRLRWWCLRA